MSSIVSLHNITNLSFIVKYSSYFQISSFTYLRALDYSEQFSVSCCGIPFYVVFVVSFAGHGQQLLYLIAFLLLTKILLSLPCF